VTVVTDVKTLLAMVGGALDPKAAERAGRIRVEGNRTALAALPQLFDGAGRPGRDAVFLGLGPATRHGLCFRSLPSRPCR